MKGPFSRVATLSASSLLVSLSLSTATEAAAADVPEVVSVHAPAMDWPEARRNVEAELRASGFDVQARQSLVRDPGSLLAELPLHAAKHSRSVGSVTVIRVGTTGLAYVWVREHERLFRVDAPSAEANVAAGMLALRVADLMAVRPWKVQEPLPPPAKDEGASAPPEAPTDDGSPGVRSWDGRPWVWLGVGAVSGITSTPPGAQVSLGVNVPLWGPTSLDVGGAASVVPLSARLPEGPAVVNHQQLGGHLMVRASGGEHWSLAAGLGGSGLCLQAQGTPHEAARGLRDATCVGLLSGRARVLFRWHEVLLWAMAEPGWALPGVRLRTDQRADVTVGRPWLAAAVGVGWRL